MTYIINPFIFYLSNFLDNFSTLSIIVFSISLVAAISFGIFLCYEINDNNCFECDGNETPLIKLLKKMLKISTITLIITATLMTLIPSEETIDKMIISSFITKENIEGAKKDAKELVDYIVEKAAELKTSE